MQHFHLQADCGEPQQLVPVMHALTGKSDIRLSKLNLDDGPAEAAAVNIAWYRRPGRFGLDVTVWGDDIRPRDTKARFALAFAKELGRAVLFSDCTPFPFSYYMANPDGAIWYVVIRIGDEDTMDLQTDDAVDSDHFTPVPIFAPGTPLAEAIAPAPKSAFATCDRSSDARLCEVFAMRCPKHGRI